MNNQLAHPTPGTTINLSPPVGSADAGALVLSRVFDAPPDAVFALWSDPAHVKAWWHPEGFTTPVFDMDFRVGGSFRYAIAAHGRKSWAQGVYREIDAPRRIVMTFRWDSGDPAHDKETLITVTFELEGERSTLMTFRQEPFDSDAARHSHGQGWSQVLDAFDRFLILRKQS